MLCFTTRLLYENVVKTQMDRKEVWYNLDVYNPAEKSNIFASRDKVGDPSRSGRRIFFARATNWHTRFPLFLLLEEPAIKKKYIARIEM